MSGELPLTGFIVPGGGGLSASDLEGVYVPVDGVDSEINVTNSLELNAVGAGSFITITSGVGGGAGSSISISANGAGSDLDIGAADSTYIAAGTGTLTLTAPAVDITGTTVKATHLLHSLVVEQNTAGSGAPNLLTTAETGKALTNEGTTAVNYHTLPAAEAGLVYSFFAQDADGIRVAAQGDDVIHVLDRSTAAAGYIETTTQWSMVTLKAINATDWIATEVHGVWTNGTWNFDDRALIS